MNKTICLRLIRRFFLNIKIRCIFFSFLLFPIVLASQTLKKVAVMETKKVTTTVTDFQANMVRGGMETAVSNTDGYIAYDRSAFDAIMQEHKFQRSGAVNESEIKNLGEMAGVQYVLVTEASVEDGYMFILAKILDVETGRYDNSYDVLCEVNPMEIKKACGELGRKLFGKQIVINDNKSKEIVSDKKTTTNSEIIEIKIGNVSFEMVKVEAGTFVMGCSSEQGEDCDSDESPYQKVIISKDFYIGKYEVTQELWETIMGKNPSKFIDSDNPVEMVTWKECVTFCSELSRITGKYFRLPTEAEWEYAARGGQKATSSKYAGSSFYDNVAWCSDNSKSKTHSVGQKSPNELYIYDMSGNVWEWCYDWYGGYSGEIQTDPIGPNFGQYRIIRGGSWYENGTSCRVSNRKTFNPAIGYYDIGLRIVLVL